MPAVKKTFFTQLLWNLHPHIYRASGGKVLGKLGDNQILLLTTKGRKSGQPRTKALAYLTYGDASVVIGSFAGGPNHPSWWLNLLADPSAKIQRGAEVLEVRAREAEGEEREKLWSEMTAIEDGFNTDQEWTKRKIPVVVLDPV